MLLRLLFQWPTIEILLQLQSHRPYNDTITKPNRNTKTTYSRCSSTQSSIGPSTSSATV